MLPLESLGYYMLGSRVAACLGRCLFAGLHGVFSGLLPAGGFSATSADWPIFTIAAAQLSIRAGSAGRADRDFLREAPDLRLDRKESVADHTALIAALLTAGSAFGCMVSIPSALQLAYGWTSLGFWSGLFSLCASIPLLLILTKYFGAAGAAGVKLIISAQLT